LSYIAKQLSLAAPTEISIDPHTIYRQNTAIRTYLAVTPWSASARAIASKAVAVAAETRLDPANLANAAIDGLIRDRRELPHCLHCSDLRAMPTTESIPLNGSKA